MNDTIQYLPVIALRGTTILPDMIVHFDVSRKKSVKALEKAMVEDQRVFLIPEGPSDRRSWTRGSIQNWNSRSD